MKQNIILVICIIIVITFWIMSFQELNKNYIIQLTSLQSIHQIKLKRNDMIKVITNQTDIEMIYSLLKDRKTKIESIQDRPSYDYIELTLEENITLFLYEWKNNFYIEQPYNGIFPISDKDYKIVEKILGE